MEVFIDFALHLRDQVADDPLVPEVKGRSTDLFPHALEYGWPSGKDDCRQQFIPSCSDQGCCGGSEHPTQRAKYPQKSRSNIINLIRNYRRNQLRQQGILTLARFNRS